MAERWQVTLPCWDLYVDASEHMLAQDLRNTCTGKGVLYDERQVDQ